MLLLPKRSLFSFPLPVVSCFALIFASAVLNAYLALDHPASHRLSPSAAFAILTFDALQLAGLLYMTGGLVNPFSLLMAVPVVVSASAHSRFETVSSQAISRKNPASSALR